MPIRVKGIFAEPLYTSSIVKLCSPSVRSAQLEVLGRMPSPHAFSQLSLRLLVGPTQSGTCPSKVVLALFGLCDGEDSIFYPTRQLELDEKPIKTTVGEIGDIRFDVPLHCGAVHSNTSHRPRSTV
jgi:hypothetical protein